MLSFADQICLQIVGWPAWLKPMPMAKRAVVHHMPAPVHTRCRIINRIPGRQPVTHSMKRHIEKPSERIMQFFTPQLYLQFNSADDAVADRANARWERAVGRYRQHLDELGQRLTPEVRSLTNISLHDADVLTFDPEAELRSENALAPLSVALLTVRHQEEIISLIYSLSDCVRESRKPRKWPLAEGQVQWLYDEVDAIEGPTSRFVHRILLSDGRALEIPFYAVLIHRAEALATL